MRALENADRIREAPARLPTASRADLTAEWLRPVWLRTTVKAPAGAADGGHRLSLRVGEDGSRPALPRRPPPLAAGGCLPDHRRPVAGAAVLRGEAMTAPARRGAVYTRKSSEEGLEQDFNSLHAQREACEAFIHRTWLQPDGLAKASFREPRLSLGPIGGGAVGLPPPGELLLVGEGIATTASGMAATRLPA